MSITHETEGFMEHARPFLAELAAMAAEAAGSDNPEVVSLALALVDRQPDTVRKLLARRAGPGSGDTRKP